MQDEPTRHDPTPPRPAAPPVPSGPAPRREPPPAAGFRARWGRRWGWLRSRLRPRLVWDLFMVYLALLNVGLILFDLTYLWLRPHYRAWTPAVVELYDPVKGIEPHPLTEEMGEGLDELRRLLAAAPTPLPASPAALPPPLSRELPARLDRLATLTAEVLDENPFERSGQTENLNVLRSTLVETLGLPATAEARLDESELARRFWSWDADLPARTALLDERAGPRLHANFYRAYGPDGQPVDHFWWIDLPFLLFFAAEFFTRWGLALRRRTYARWYIFPIVHWYDLLGIIPSKQFRVFRLFRVVSIYIRLHRSEVTSIGDDLVSRGVRRFADVISEEITDRVSVRILNLMQQEIRAGALSRITRNTLMPRRSEVREQIVDRLTDLVADPELHEHGGRFLRANLDRAVDSSPALSRLPLPRAVKAPLVTLVGEIVYDAVVETLTATLRSAEGRAALDDLVDEVMDVFAGQLGRGEIEALIEQTVLDLLEEMKGSVQEKRWLDWLSGKAPPPGAAGVRKPATGAPAAPADGTTTDTATDTAAPATPPEAGAASAPPPGPPPEDRTP